MLLTITTTHPPATDLGSCCTSTRRRRSRSTSPSGGPRLLPRGDRRPLHRGAAAGRGPGRPRARRGGTAGDGYSAQYVNDRPYVASSFLSVAIAAGVRQRAGRAVARSAPELAETPLPLVARARGRPCRGGEPFLRRLFEPLGYAVDRDAPPARRAVPGVGRRPYFTVELARDRAAGGPALAPLRPHSGARRREALLGRTGRGGEAPAARRRLAGDHPERSRSPPAT